MIVKLKASDKKINDKKVVEIIFISEVTKKKGNH